MALERELSARKQDPLADSAALGALLDQGDGRDRAYVDALLRMGWARVSDPSQRAELLQLHARVARVAQQSHAAIRAEIAAGSLRGAELRQLFDAVPLLERDHHVEEVLGIAYPPLDEPALGQDRMAYLPSGYDEIVHAFDATGLAASDRFLDIGSGLGKVTLLAALLTGATCAGVEHDAKLHELARSAARELGVAVTHERADASQVPLGAADVYFMYLPFSGDVLRAVLKRLVPGRFLCAGALELRDYPELALAGPAQLWLQIYAWA